MDNPVSLKWSLHQHTGITYSMRVGSQHDGYGTPYDTHINLVLNDSVVEIVGLTTVPSVALWRAVLVACSRIDGVTKVFYQRYKDGKHSEHIIWEKDS